MRPALTSESFGKLLDCFDSDRERAGEQYQHLRETLIRFFEWRGASFPEEHADETFDRVSMKLANHVEIANIRGYCYEVARLVWLETLKKPDRRFISLDAAGAPVPVQPEPLTPDADSRLTCLEACLQALSPERRELILEYYRGENPARITQRKVLAERLGLQRETLANRAQRLRSGLEQCVRRCASKNRPI
jgi:DNA-directed RNA polymerase specialized sigma24 family protein